MKGFARMLYMHATVTPKPLPNDIDLSTQTALVTGANGGLGLEAAKDLVGRNLGRLIVCARSTRNQENALGEIQKVNPHCKIDFWIVDYDSYESMLALGRKVSALERLDIAILNAGVRQLEFQLTPGTGHEQNFQVNHVGTSLLSLLLYPALQRTSKELSKPSRLTIVSSIVHWWTPFHEYKSSNILDQLDKEESMKGHAPHDRYGTTKLLNILWTLQFASRVRKTDVIINTVDPGLCKSDLHRHEGRLYVRIVEAIFGWTAAQGGHNIANAAVAQSADSHGRYVSSEQIVKPASDFVESSEGADAQKRVWSETIQLLEREVPEFVLPNFEL